MAIKEKINPANIICIILHPLMMTVYSVCLLFVYADFSFIMPGQFFSVFIRVFLLSCLIPGLGVFFLRKATHMPSFDEGYSTDRIKILFITFFSYFLLFYSFAQTNLYTWFLGLLFAPLAIIAFCLIINIWTKTSMYMIGIGGLIGGVMSVCYSAKHTNPFYLFIILFLLAGILATARLYLQKDKPVQVYFGFIFGFLLTYLCVWIGANFVYLYLLYMNF